MGKRKWADKQGERILKHIPAVQGILGLEQRLQPRWSRVKEATCYLPNQGWNCSTILETVKVPS